MATIITSTDKSVTITRDRDQVYAKNRVDFDLVKTTVYFRMNGEELFNEELTAITVNGTGLTEANAKGLLSDALFRNASGGGTPGGDNWEQTDF